jgi:hypothetical protein
MIFASSTMHGLGNTLRDGVLNARIQEPGLETESQSRTARCGGEFPSLETSRRITISLTVRYSVIAFLICILTISIDASAQNTGGTHGKKTNAANLPAVFWREPTDIIARDLFYGPGGEAQQPKGRFTFIEEDLNGSSPKFYVEDQQGQRWLVKLGSEARPETAASRLAWAAGYFTDEDYYLPELHVEGMRPLRRGQGLVSSDGTIHGARLKRHVKGEKHVGNWSWFDNPFIGSQELNGLKVLMALFNNWDLKEANNKIYLVGEERRYLVSDLGASFSRNSNPFSRSKGDAAGYVRSKFIAKYRPSDVDLIIQSRPLWVRVAGLFAQRKYAGAADLGRHIPRADARWIGSLLGQLSASQISDAFRAAGYGPEETKSLTNKVRERIAELNNL